MDVEHHGDPNVTDLLLAWGAGNAEAMHQLAPLVYRELHRLAHQYMRKEREDHTLQTSALVNEAYLKLVDVRRIRWQNRGHFFAMAGRLMRRILVDFARRRHYQKRGGGAEHIDFDENLTVVSSRSQDLVIIDDALNALAEIDKRKVQVVEMRFFAGLEVQEIAESLNVSPETVRRDWRLARAWLKREIRKGSSKPVLQ
jgi:RNA polymerase sigma factor (TIGR02999 family)